MKSKTGVLTKPSQSKIDTWIRAFLQNAITVFLMLYVTSLTCSMAGMEIFSWTLFLLFILYAAWDRGQTMRFHTLGVEIPLICLLLIVVVGLKINAPEGDFVYAIGRFRNFILLFAFTFCFQLFKKPGKLALIIISCATVISVYGIWQHFTGIDLWRHNHRAVVLLPWTDKQLYSTVGFFNHHLTYAHSYAMILCIPVALLLVFKNKITRTVQIALFLSFFLIATSIVFTYGRGVWLALLFSIPTMCLFVNRRLFLFTFIGLLTVGGVLFKTDKVFRDRVNSVFADNYRSNDDRRKLWEANIEMFREHPWLGVGFHQNEDQTLSYYKKLGITDGIAGHAHNNYIEFLATTGATGLFCYLAFMFLFLRKTIRLFFASAKEDLWLRFLILAALGAQLTFHLGGITQCNIADFKVQHQLIFWLALVSFFYNQNQVKIRQAIIQKRE